MKGWHERQIRTDFGRVTRAQLAVLTSDVPAHGDWLYEVSSMATGELATLRHERSPIGGRHPSVPGAPKSHRPARQQWSLLGVSRVHPPASKGGGFRGVGYYVDLSFLSSAFAPMSAPAPVKELCRRRQADARYDHPFVPRSPPWGPLRPKGDVATTKVVRPMNPRAHARHTLRPDRKGIQGSRRRCPAPRRLRFTGAAVSGATAAADGASGG